MKARILRRILIALLTGIIPAIQVYLSPHLPPEIIQALSGLVVMLGVWGMSKWLGSDIEPIQEELIRIGVLEGTPSGIVKARTIDALVTVANDPDISMQRGADGKIRIERARPVRTQDDAERDAQLRFHSGRRP